MMSKIEIQCTEYGYEIHRLGQIAYQTDTSPKQLLKHLPSLTADLNSSELNILIKTIGCIVTLLQTGVIAPQLVLGSVDLTSQ